MDDALVKKLIASTSFQSLVTEEEVKSAFKQEGWQAIQSTFYKDLSTRVLREVDVLARNAWWCDMSARLTLEVVVEVKTMKGFHLLFSPYTASEAGRRLGSPNASGHLMRRWIGAEGHARTP
jgi:hypothetical protein